MISTLRGQVSASRSGQAVVEVGGVGLLVHIPLGLGEGLRPGERIAWHTHLVVREDSLTLYGFEKAEERELFILLMSVSGVGPRLALAILSTLTPDAVRRAVFQDQAEVFSRVPGVGKKTAQKIHFSLKDRLGPADGLDVTAPMTDVDTDLLAALTSLGYSVVEAQAALQSLPREAPEDLEERLRLALQYFSS
jgi:Holliday junction DNA helicase RuvA